MKNLKSGWAQYNTPNKILNSVSKISITNKNNIWKMHIVSQISIFCEFACTIRISEPQCKTFPFQITEFLFFKTLSIYLGYTLPNCTQKLTDAFI